MTYHSLYHDEFGTQLSINGKHLQRSDNKYYDVQNVQDPRRFEQISITMFRKEPQDRCYSEREQRQNIDKVPWVIKVQTNFLKKLLRLLSNDLKR